MTDYTLMVEGVLMAGSLLVGMALAQMPEGYKPPKREVDWEGFKARLRAENSVRIVTEEEAGNAIASQPNGVYGYSYSVSFDNPVPVFHKPAFQAFELHRLGNGDVVILGCLTPQDAERMRGGDFTPLKLYPEPYDEAVEPVALNYKHIVRSNNKMSRAYGNYIEFDVKTGA